MPVNKLYNFCHVLSHKSRQLKVPQHVTPERQHLLYLVDKNVFLNLNSPHFHLSQVLIDRPHDFSQAVQVGGCVYPRILLKINYHPWVPPIALLLVVPVISCMKVRSFEDNVRLREVLQVFAQLHWPCQVMGAKSLLVVGFHNRDVHLVNPCGLNFVLARVSNI